MTWEMVRQTYPHQWVLVEAVEARTDDGQRILDRLAVVDAFPDSLAAWRDYSELHRRHPERELYVLHSGREQPDVRDTGRVRLGLR